MSILGRSFRTSQVVRIDSRALVRIALEAYKECGLDLCCDPTEMGERLGFDIQMTEGCAEIVGGILFCPALLSRRESGEAVYRVLGSYLLNRSHRTFRHDDAAGSVAEELMLPRCVSEQIESSEIPVVQRYVTLDTLRRICLGRRESGTQPVAASRAIDQISG